MNNRWSLKIAIAMIATGLLVFGCTTGNPSGLAGKRTGGRPHDSEAESDAELEKRVRTMAHYATGLSYELNDKSSLALDEFVHAAEADPANEPVVIEAVRRCLHDQKSAKAIELLTRATESPGVSGAVYAWLGLAYAQAGKTELAVAANRTAIKRMPQNLAAYQNLAQIYLQNSRTNEALNVLNEAAEQPADNPGFLLDLADLYLRYARVQSSQATHVNQRVEELLGRAAKMEPSSAIQTLRLADDYFALGNFKNAEPLYRQLLDEHPDLPVRGKLTEIYLRSGQKEKASQQLEVLAQSEPTNPQAYVFLGALDADEKKFSEAAENFERALKLDPDLEQVYYDLAGIKLTLKKPAEALTVLDQARLRFKRSFAMEFYSGITYGALTNYTEALKYLISAEAVAKATEPARLNSVFYFQMGSAYERSGNIEEAEKYFRECLKLAPEDAEAMNYLGYMWAERGIKLDEARTMIEQAVKSEPENSAFLDSFAWVLFKLKRPSEALPPMLKAIEHSEKLDATLYDHLGDIYAALKQYDQARDAWHKALQSEPNEQIQRKLEAAPGGESPSH